MPSPPLILLFGMPRSGTSWIGKILDSHPETLYRHEPDAGGKLNGLPLGANASDAARYGDTVAEFVRGLPRTRSAKVASTMPIFPKRYYSPFSLLWLKAAVLASKAGDRLIRDFPVIGPRPSGRAPAPVVVWKSVESLTRLGVLVRVLEDYRAIILMRHPCGYVASELRGRSLGRFVEDDRPSEDYGLFTMLLGSRPAKRRGLTLDALRALDPIERLAWNWVLQNEIALEDTETFHTCRRVRYEDICEAPINRTRELLAFCGLPWDAQTEEFIRTSTSQHRDGYYSVFKDPARAASRWKKDLSAGEIAKIYGVVEQSSLVELYPRESD
jgi:hypothetical protein